MTNSQLTHETQGMPYYETKQKMQCDSLDYATRRVYYYV